jgi:suppressor of ftsI/bilirubin oxidase
MAGPSDSCVNRLPTRRRNFLKALSALGIYALPRAALSDDRITTGSAALRDFCGTGTNAQPLFIPGASGLFGRLAPDGAPLRMRATAAAARPGALAYLVEHRGRRFVNPTLVLRHGERVRIDFDNALRDPTIVHWHGLAVDTRNDGAGMTLAAPGERYAYDFEVRDRAALYWYHPHPHGMTGAQAYRGLFGMIEVEDEDERRLRSALDLMPGQTEIPLVLQDRRGNGYNASDADRMHGFLGDAVYINGAACPYLDVASRIYRFRVLNASNARTYRLGLRAADGKRVPFTLIGSDGGLLPSPIECNEAFIASAERIDMLVDLSDASVGDTLVLETGAFDPMHMEMGGEPDTAAAVDHAAMGHAIPPSDAKKQDAIVDHAAMGHGGSFPEGAPRALLQLRVRKQIAYAAGIPPQLSTISPINVTDATDRPLRLGFAKGRWRINDRVRDGGDAHRSEARHGGDVADPQLLQQHAACDAPARLSFPGTRTPDQPRTDHRAEGRQRRPAGNGSRLERHGARLAG